MFWVEIIMILKGIIDEDFSNYKVVVAPMLFMTRRGFKERIEKFVENGGTFITTYISGMVDEYNLCWQGDGFYPLGNVLGINFEDYEKPDPREELREDLATLLRSAEDLPPSSVYELIAEIHRRKEMGKVDSSD